MLFMSNSLALKRIFLAAACPAFSDVTVFAPKRGAPVTSSSNWIFCAPKPHRSCVLRRCTEIDGLESVFWRDLDSPLQLCSACSEQ